MNNMKLTTKEYWHCIIGPIESYTLPDGADLPMRNAVARAFENLPGCPVDEEGFAYYILWSGWGMTEDQVEAVQKAAYATPSNLKRTVELRGLYVEDKIALKDYGPDLNLDTNN